MRPRSAAGDAIGAGLLTGLVWAYNFNESSGSAVEAVAGLLDLTAVNSPGAEAASSPGGIGGARTFVTASSQYFRHDSDDAFHFYGADGVNWTWDLFVKPGTSGNKVVFGKDHNTDGREFLLLYNSGDGLFSYSSWISINGISSTYAAASGSWHHVLVDYVGDTKLIGIEVDGNRDEATLGNHPSYLGAPDAPFCIGAREFPGFEDYITASINSFCRWSRLLTAEEKTYRQAMLKEYPWA